MLAALAPATGPFGAPETVTPTADAPFAAFDATGNRWWLVFGDSARHAEPARRLKGSDPFRYSPRAREAVPLMRQLSRKGV